jgi:hypothetical protein
MTDRAWSCHGWREDRPRRAATCRRDTKGPGARHSGRRHIAKAFDAADRILAEGERRSAKVTAELGKRLLDLGAKEQP